MHIAFFWGHIVDIQKHTTQEGCFSNTRWGSYQYAHGLAAPGWSPMAAKTCAHADTDLSVAPHSATNRPGTPPSSQPQHGLSLPQDREAQTLQTLPKLQNQASCHPHSVRTQPPASLCASIPAQQPLPQFEEHRGHPGLARPPAPRAPQQHPWP